MRDPIAKHASYSNGLITLNRVQWSIKTNEPLSFFPNFKVSDEKYLKHPQKMELQKKLDTITNQVVLTVDIFNDNALLKPKFTP